MKKKFIYVMPTDTAGNCVVLHERHADHPDGEIFLRGYSDAARRGPKKVGNTQGIKDKIHAGLLIETTATGKQK